jgi:hypothetical protein
MVRVRLPELSVIAQLRPLVVAPDCAFAVAATQNSAVATIALKSCCVFINQFVKVFLLFW